MDRHRQNHFSWHAGLPERFGQHLRHERRDAAEHRQRILEVARRLFAEQGVDAVSMHQIALVCGIGQGTLYRRYAHKGELCMDLLRESNERFIEEVSELLEASSDSPALEQLDALLAHIIAFLEEHGALLGPVAAPEMRSMPCNEADKPRHYSFQHETFYPWLHQLFARLLTKAVDGGDMISLDVNFTADALLATLHPMFYRFQREERGLTPECIMDGLRRIYIEGVKMPPG